MNTTDRPCLLLEYHAHRCAFIDTFIVESRRWHWFSLTANRPTMLRKSPPKLLKDLEESLCSKRATTDLNDQSRMGVYYNFEPASHPLFVSVRRAIELASNEDAIFYIEPGQLAYFFHDRFVVECKSAQSGARVASPVATPTLSEIAWNKAWKAICRRVKSVTSRTSPVVFSSYKTDESGIPLDNLDDVAIRGRAVIVAKAADGAWGGAKSRDYESEVVTKPTWLDLCAILHDQIKCTRDQHHVCLEGVEKVGQKTIDGKRVSKYALLLGS